MSILKTERIDDLAVIRINVEGESVNTLNPEFLDEIEDVIKSINQDDSILGAIFISSKPDCFIAGADIKILEKANSVQMGEDASRLGQHALQVIEDSKKPILAAIHGSCLGGGAEFALACHYLLATDHPKTVFAFPEVLLGLLPGAGGTQRLPQKIGIQKSLDLMLTGKNVRAKQAKKISLIDELTEKETLETKAIKTLELLVKNNAKNKIKKSPKKLTLLELVLESNPMGRSILFSKTKSVVLKKSKGLYPAPIEIISAIQTGVERGPLAGYAAESSAFGKLLQTPTAKNLISLFFANTKLKRNPYPKPSVTDEKVGIVGAGQMGVGIALVSLLHKKETTLKDVSDASLERAKKSITDELSKKSRSELLSEVHFQKDLHGFEKIDFLIEAVFEDLALKHKVIEELEGVTPNHCIIASNTSAIPIAEIAAKSKRPENIIGMHYFSPVHKMPLLEIIRHPKNSDEVVSRAVQMGVDQGKTVIVVKDSPGFYTTRVLASLMNETIVLLQEDFDPISLDQAMKNFGFPVGPITLFDEVGIDTASHISDFLSERIEGYAPVPLLKALADSGLHGRKAGKGFFLYSEKSKKRINPQALEVIAAHRSQSMSIGEKEVQSRLTARFVNEALLCLQEGVLSSVVEGDLGAVFGLGFPPALGGPFRYVDRMGIGTYLATLKELELKYGQRFKAPKILNEKASQNLNFCSGKD